MNALTKISVTVIKSECTFMLSCCNAREAGLRVPVRGHFHYYLTGSFLEAECIYGCLFEPAKRFGAFMFEFRP
jgi:hypothetical protein